ncbi:MAG: hypothetical protein JRN52_04760 [Nitrososphaerota archaeon]|nr:hypothetical protein [Nitrososphaerota archaeon]
MQSLKTTIRLSPEISKLFQSKVTAEAGKLKGAQNEKLNEAALLWLGYKGVKHVVSVTTIEEGSKPVTIEHVESIFTKFLRNGWKESTGITVRALFSRIQPKETATILRAFKKFPKKEIKYVSKFGEEVKFENIDDITRMSEAEEGNFVLRFDAGNSNEYQIFATDLGIALQCTRELVPFMAGTEIQNHSIREHSSNAATQQQGVRTAALAASL